VRTSFPLSAVLAGRLHRPWRRLGGVVVAAMIDPSLERQYGESQELKEMWELFYEFFKVGIKGGDGITPENEGKFLEVKSRIAMLHDSFMEPLKKQDERQMGQNVRGIIGRTITLRHISRLTDVDIKKMNLEWNECFLLINSSVSALEDKREKLAVVSPFAYHSRRYWLWAKARFLAFVRSTAFRAIVGLAIFVGAFTAFFAFGGGEAMKKIGALAPVYYFVEDGYRSFINKSYPFDQIARFKKTTRALPSGWEDLGNSSLTPKDLLVNNVTGNLNRDIGDPLAKSTEYEAYRLRYAPTSGTGGGEMEVHLFRLDTSFNAQTMFTKIQEWRSNTPQAAVQNVDNNMRFLRRNNVVVLLYKGTGIMMDRASGDIFYGTRRP